jgi:peptidoglycan/xylan/chitin deacetylase (PgdA/CDA1 family)
VVIVKQLIKRTAQGMVASIAPKVWGGAGSLLVLMYHRVLPPAHRERGTEQPGMYVSPETLKTHLDLLKKHFVLLHLDDWQARRVRGESLPARACAITFDDGWRDNYDHAWPVLRSAGVPATIFVVSKLVGTRYVFWPNRLARLLGQPRDAATSSRLLTTFTELGLSGSRMKAGLALSPAEIDAAILVCKATRTDAEMAIALDQFSPNDAASTGRDLMDWNEIREMSASDQIRIGSHTRTHTRLIDGLTADVLKDEVEYSLGEIEANLGSRVRTFCYPNGDHSSAAVKSVSEHYQCAVTTRRGWNNRDSDPHLLARVGVHDEVSNTPTAFLSRLAGIG